MSKDQKKSLRKLAAIVFSDMVDFTKTMSKDEQLGLSYTKKHSSIIRDKISNYQGRLLKELGDGCLMIFDSAYDAVRFSQNLQKVILSDCDFKVRVGIHVGDIIEENDDYFGSGVKRCSNSYEHFISFIRAR